MALVDQSGKPISSDAVKSKGLVLQICSKIRSAVPGWVLTVIGAMLFLLDWKSRVEEIISTASQIGPVVAVFLKIATSPLFGIGLIILGLAFIVFVPQERYPSSRIAVTIVAWAACALSLVALGGLLMAGLLTSSQAELEHLKQRVLSDEQARVLAATVNNVPTGEHFNLMILAIPECEECARYADDITPVWRQIPGWTVTCTVGTILNHRLKGIVIANNPSNCPTTATNLIDAALTAAKIEHRFSDKDDSGILGSYCGLFIGSKP